MQSKKSYFPSAQAIQLPLFNSLFLTISHSLPTFPPQKIQTNAFHQHQHCWGNNLYLQTTTTTSSTSSTSSSNGTQKDEDAAKAVLCGGSLGCHIGSTSIKLHQCVHKSCSLP